MEESIGERVRIEGPSESLEELRRELLAEVGRAVDVEPVSAAVPGELREPLLVALVISASSTTAVAIKTVGAIIERWMAHAERKELLRIYRERDDAPLNLDDLRTELWDDE